jgi:putative flippase GtrA
MEKEHIIAGTESRGLIPATFRQILRKFTSKNVGMLNRLIRHLLSGGIGTVLYAGSVAFFVEVLNVHPVYGAFFAFIILEVYTYIVYRIWVYNPSNRHIQAIPRFIIVIFVALFLNMGIMYLVVEVLNWWYGFGILCSVIIVPITNFLLNYYWVFNK